MHFFGEHAGRIADVALPFVGIWFGWWLSDRVRSRADRAAEKAALRAQADALITAVLDVRMAALTGHTLWDSLVEHGRTVFLAAIAGAGEVARARTARASDRASVAAGLGAAVHVIAQERIASKQYAATVREPLYRLTTAAAPLLRHPDAQVSESASALVNVTFDIKKDTQNLDTALAAFHAAVTTAEQEPASRWRRLRPRLG
ncbi:hypothetical protein GCM10010121_054950 [Streptomyces brasiliensis]|uniref:Uncharacterized protein n=2 Tax=Streptomyces brasiliensis TaxID=1954 RepID=A0A917L2M3_9ACTN|nr:hypothetical protein GCM10010121_054950 [Streptomyces brasiliensis]